MDKKAGWKIKKGNIKNEALSDEDYWRYFNLFFKFSKKRNSYKFGILKSILDNLFNFKKDNEEYVLSHDDLFAKFSENYWNLVLKYEIKQMRKDGKSEYSQIEKILMRISADKPSIKYISFENLDNKTKTKIIEEVKNECKKYVLGALYKDFDGCLYAFDLSKNNISISYSMHSFLLKFKSELEELNYYHWAKFLEDINSAETTTRLIDKLEMSTPRRSDLSIYREILLHEFKENTCFYCGGKLTRKIHVDHFIPWSFTKEDKLWNFVLSCPECNEKKSNYLVSKRYIEKLKTRNEKAKQCLNEHVVNDFGSYESSLIDDMWNSAKDCGFKELKEK